MSDLLHSLNTALDVHFLIASFGYPGVFAIVFAETGLMLGFFLPGDSLLITAGVFASKGTLNIYFLLFILFVAGVLGNIVGYFFGQSIGKRLFEKKDSRLFHKEHVNHAQAFYQKHGGRAIILARFIPVIRTFAPIVAGITDMAFPLFFLYTLLGGFLWTVSITMVGFFLGKFIPDKYFEVIVLAVMVISVSPGLYEVLKTPEQRKKVLHRVRKALPSHK